ncbi:MAG: phage protease [Candidatus Binataceae bacterium]
MNDIQQHGSGSKEQSRKADGNPPELSEWIQLLPAGEFTGRDGRGPYRLSDPEAVVAATRELRMEAGIPIDYDHATDFAAPEGRPAPAAGWIRNLEVRDGAIWGQVEWTRHGAAAVATLEYRYVSPVFEFSASGDVKRLLRAALTNNPNLYLTAIAARLEAADTGNGIQRLPHAQHDRGYQGASMDELMAQLREILGLAGDAEPTEAVECVRALTRERAAKQDHEAHDTAAAAGVNAAAFTAVDPAHFVPVAQLQNALTELNSLRAARAHERAEHAVNEAIRSGRLTPAQREWAIAYCQADESGFANFIARQPSVLSGAFNFDGEPPPRVQHSGDSTARGRVSTALNNTERAICSRLGISADDFVQRRIAREDPLKLNQV